MDKEFFAQEIESRGNMMYRVAFTILRNDDDCKDAMQETALKAWEKRSSLKEIKHFATWMTRILINECRNIQRKRQRIVPFDEAPEPITPPHDPTLAMALQALPEKLRLPMVLRYSEDMDCAEIAKILRLPQTTIYGRIRRAKQQLRKELEA